MVFVAYRKPLIEARSLNIRILIQSYQLRPCPKLYLLWIAAASFKGWILLDCQLQSTERLYISITYRVERCCFLCRDGTENHDSIEKRARRANGVNTSSNIGKRQSALQEETVATDSAGATVNVDSEPRENKNHNSAVDHSLQDHQYSGNFKGHFRQVRGQKRKRSCLTENDQSSDSDYSCVDNELAENDDVVSNEHDTAVTKVKRKKQAVDKCVCEVCGWICSKSESLEAHLHTHTGEMSMEHNVSVPVDTTADTHTCELCGMVFSANEEFRKHVVEVHKKSVDDQSTFVVPLTNTTLKKIHNVQQKEDKLYAGDRLALCYICGWVSKNCKRRPSLIKHMSSKHSTEKPFKCGRCSLTFKSKTNLQRHEIMHASVRRFLCQYCAESFQQKASLMCHMCKHHADKLHSDPNSRQVSCRFCSEKFYRYSEVQSHIRAQHQSAFCERCGKIFACNDKLRNHVCVGARVADRKPCGGERRGPTRAFGCNICDMSFCIAVRLERHITAIHGTDDMGSIYKCCLCNEQFELMTALESHASEEHNIVPPQYKCTECGKLFNLESSLKQHMHFHTANAFTCHMCGKKFDQKSTLQAHMVTHGIACEQQTTVRAEKLLSCSVCGKRFTCKHQLHNHERIHSGAKPFVCNICGRAFRQRTHLTQHRRTHTNVKPFNCSLCSKTYRNRLDLRLHSARVHNVELPTRRRNGWKDVEPNHENQG